MDMTSSTEQGEPTYCPFLDDNMSLHVHEKNIPVNHILFLTMPALQIGSFGYWNLADSPPVLNLKNMGERPQMAQCPTEASMFILLKCKPCS